MTSFAIGNKDDPWDREPTVAGLVAEYAEYVREEHDMCRGCPVVRSGVVIVRSMLEWKAIQGDGRLEHWTRRDIRDYLAHYLPTADVRRELLPDAPTCAKDLVYFLADRGSLVGDGVGVLTKATDEVLYEYVRPAAVVVWDALAVAGEWDEDGARSACAALEWIGWQDAGRLLLRRYDVQLLVWNTLPRRFLTPLEQKREAGGARSQRPTPRPVGRAGAVRDRDGHCVGERRGTAVA
jgi:hypothetical protein